MFSKMTFRMIAGECPIHNKKVYIRVMYTVRAEYLLNPINYTCDLYNDEEDYNETCANCPIWKAYKISTFYKR